MHMEGLFYFLAFVQIAVGCYLIWQGIQWLGYVRRRLLTDPGFYAPRVAVLCPCKGIEPGLERNLVALTEFNHQNYEIFFILASASDPAAGILKRVAAGSRPKAHVIIADKPEGCSEKVNNLRVAIEQLPPEFDVLVFADSDGRPGKTWLQRLSAPLNDPLVGATTTMRWLVPNIGNFASALLAAWNAPIVTMLSEKGRNFCWGGGTAIRRSVFEKIGVLEEWRTSASDDYSLTRALEQTNHSILFVPECLTFSFVETDFSGLLEFTNRQVLITRVYAEKMWAYAAATHAVLLPHSSPGTGPRVRRGCRSTNIFANLCGDVSDFLAFRHSIRVARGGRYGNFSCLTSTDHESVLDLHCAHGCNPLSILD